MIELTPIAALVVKPSTMSDEDRYRVAVGALEHAFASQISKLFGVHVSSNTPEAGIKAFKHGFSKAIRALDDIETELAAYYQRKREGL